MSNNFFVEEFGKEFEINDKSTKRILDRLIKTIKREKIVTKNLLSKIIIHNLRKVRIEEQTGNQILILGVFKHRCLEKHYNKFVQLFTENWGAKRISDYFEELGCSISKTYVTNILKFLKENKPKLKKINEDEQKPKNNDFFIEKIAEELKISKSHTKRLLNRISEILKRKKRITKNIIARVFIENLREERIEEEMANKILLLGVFKHKCLEKHYSKFLELVFQGWGSKRIENYFKNDLKCGISKTYINNVLKFLKEQENG